MDPNRALKEQADIAKDQIRQMKLYPFKFRHLLDRYQIIFDNLMKFTSREKFKKAKILDIGCRSGELLEQLKRTGKNAEDLYGIDICKDAVDVGIKERGLSNLIVGDMHKTEYENDFFDIIVASHVLEHSYDIKALRDEIFRIVKKDGKIFALVPVEGEPSEGHKKDEPDGHYFYWPRPWDFQKLWLKKFRVGILEVSLNAPLDNGIVPCSQFGYLMEPLKIKGDNS